MFFIALQNETFQFIMKQAFSGSGIRAKFLQSVDSMNSPGQCAPSSLTRKAQKFYLWLFLVWPFDKS